ncbi:MAG: AAA family ATPase [Spirochaetia bacterium]|nr:AAA family ATPase [Spirochaetia bacterium]
MDAFQEGLYARIHEPLWSKMRPKKWEDFSDYSQFSEIRNRFLNKPYSFILYGPPGSGKTTFIEILLRESRINHVELPAPSISIEDLKNAAKKAPIIIFMDEFHRFSKSRQDYLLKPIEEGKIILVGAMTESPWVYLTRPLLSRLYIKEIHPPEKKKFSDIIRNNWKKAGYLDIYDELYEKIEDYTWPDFRKAYQSLEFIYQKSVSSDLKQEDLDKILSEFLIENKRLNSNMSEDIYELLSAMIKSIRASDIDAALLYMMAMIKSDIDPALIARRLVILASEDIGLANSQALVLASEALYSIEKIGMPEAKIILSHVMIYLCMMPKSNSAYMAMKKAEVYLLNKTIKPPGYILNAGKQAKNYKYPHEKGGLTDQDYWPKDFQREKFYEPYKGIFENSLENKLYDNLSHSIKKKN